MFADAKLAHRIELADGGISREVVIARTRLAREASASGGALEPELDPITADFGGGLATFVGRSPSDRVVGLGFAPFDEADLARFEAAIAARNGQIEVKVSTLADIALPTLLIRRGYVVTEIDHVLGRALRPGLEPSVPIGVLRIERDAPFEPWRDVILDGFETPDEGGFTDPLARADLERAFAAFALVPGHERFIARCEGEVAGGAALVVTGTIAQLAGAATLPHFRRRGVQSALLTARLAYSAQQGCEVAVISTRPGSKSQENAQRAGFSVLYARIAFTKR